MKDSLQSRLYKLKLILTGITLLALGLLLSALGDYLASAGTPHVYVALARGISDVLLITGAIGIAIDFFTGRDKAAADAERTRQVLKDLTPDFVDAVINGFRVNKDQLQRVATPELLDDIATNALSLRLGDHQFAKEIYADVRDQAIRAQERWRDVKISVRLSTAVERRGAEGAPRFDVLVESEYTTVPAHAVARFACVASSDDFHDSIADSPATSTWLMLPRPGFDASKRDCFELLTFSVDGDERKIRRSERGAGQLYAVTVGDDVVAAAQPVRIRHAYRTLIDPAGHRLFLTLAQPARNISLAVDYSDTDISRMAVTDLVSSRHRPYVSQLPAGTSGRELTIEVAGWVQAGTGFTFVWTLDSEESSALRATSPAPSSRAA